MIEYGKHTIDKNDYLSIKKVLASNFLTQGKETKIFEKKFSLITNSKFSQSFNSCTSALIASCIALGLKKNDIVWTTPNSFVASSNCALICGAKVKFIDINPQSYNMSISELEKNLIKTKKKFLPKIVISVHFAGLPNQQEKIWNLSKKYKFKILEDCCHALGASYKNSTMGNCRWSDIAVFSFHPVKAITTGEGGMATTNIKKYKEILSLVASHGITKNLKKFKKKKQPSWYYEQVSLGFNFRMSDIQAALGIAQLKKLNKFIKIRNKIADFYYDNLKNLPIQLPMGSNNETLNAFHIFVVRFKNKLIRNKIYNFLLRNNVKCGFHYIPIYRQPYYHDKFKGECKEMEKYYEDALTLPIYPLLTFNQQKKIINLITNFLKKIKK
jgi:UDP-4-amino-4,6-dideoxy-N-acetyl-beta-L-altrosamine transaminase